MEKHEKPFSRGTWHYEPGNLYPVEATVLCGRMSAFFAPDLVLNQVPQTDVMIRDRQFSSGRKVAPLAPAHTGKEGQDAGVPPARTGIA
jgi:hypothetical protein